MKSDKIRSLEERVRESAVFLYSKGVLKPEIGIILGSGLNDFADRIENPLIISYNDVPNMEAGLVSDHRGQMVYENTKAKKSSSWRADFITMKAVTWTRLHFRQE